MSERRVRLQGTQERGEALVPTEKPEVFVLLALEDDGGLSLRLHAHIGDTTPVFVKPDDLIVALGRLIAHKQNDTDEKARHPDELREKYLRSIEGDPDPGRGPDL